MRTRQRAGIQFIPQLFFLTPRSNYTVGMSYANFSVSLASASWLDDPNVVSNDPHNDDVSDNSSVHDMRYIFGSGSSYDSREGTLYMTLLNTMDTDSSSDDDSTSVSTDDDSDDSDDDSDDSPIS